LHRGGGGKKAVIVSGSKVRYQVCLPSGPATESLDVSMSDNPAATRRHRWSSTTTPGESVPAIFNG
jgi:hypothetical protein